MTTALRAVRTAALSASDLEVLETLALWHPPDGCPFAAGAMAWAGFGSDPERLEEAWQAYAEAVRDREALALGDKPWFIRFDEAALPPGMAQQDAAIDLACNIADEALNHFLHGGPR